MRAIEAAVYEPDGITLVVTLGSDSKREWLDDLSAEGSGTLEVKLGHADDTALQPGRIVRMSIDGTARYQWLVEELDPTYADPQNRQSGRVVKATGRGVLALLEDAVVYPELGLGRISPETRYFNFASWDYDDSAWTNAVELKTQSDPDDSLPWYGAPKGWPDPNATWIGPTGSLTPPVDPGDVYFRGTFTIPAGEGGEYRFFTTADDGFEWYLDGNKIASEQGVGLWGATRQFDQLLDEGDHLVAVKATNFDRPVAATNVFGFIMSVYPLLGGGVTLGDVISGSSSGTSMLAYPAKAPGMTPGKILDVLLTEAQTRGLLTDLSWDFTDTLDSNGDAWPKEIDISFPVNTSLLNVVKSLVAEHACDVAMAPSGLVLHAYKQRGVDLSGTVTAEYGVNIGRLGFKKTRAGFNTTLSRTAEGRWVETRLDSAVTAWGRREIGLSLGGAPSDDAADRQAKAFFDDQADPIEAVTDMQLEVVTVEPYSDFDVGDVISSTNSSGGLSSFRMQALRVTEDRAGNPIYTPELVKVPSYWESVSAVWADTEISWAGAA